MKRDSASQEAASPKRSRRRNAGERYSQLCGLLRENKRVVFITGAGLSAASGIKLFRHSKDAVWYVFIVLENLKTDIQVQIELTLRLILREASLFEWGTRQKFMKDELIWYNEFWLKHFSSEQQYLPNAGHVALSQLCRNYSNVKVITQNIDQLHSHPTAAIPPEQLIEIHGRLNEYKCVREACSYADSGALRNFTLKSSGLSREDLPVCSECGAIMCPNCLLFDEDYNSHSSYQFDKALEWMNQADGVAFVGTSFAVHITDLAFQIATRHSIPLYNFNITNDIPASKTSNLVITYVHGKSEESLPQLCNATCT